MSIILLQLSTIKRLGNSILLLLLLVTMGKEANADDRPRLANGVYKLVDHPSGGYRGTSAIDGRVVRYGMIFSNAIPKEPGSDEKWKRVIIEFNDPRATGRLRSTVTPDRKDILGDEQIQVDLFGTGYAWASDEGWRKPGEYRYTPIGLATLNVTYTNGVLEWRTAGSPNYRDVLFGLHRNPDAAGIGTVTFDYDVDGAGGYFVFDWKARPNSWGLLFSAGDWLDGGGYFQNYEQTDYWERYQGDFSGQGKNDEVGSVSGRMGEEQPQPTSIIALLDPNHGRQMFDDENPPHSGFFSGN